MCDTKNLNRRKNSSLDQQAGGSGHAAVDNRVMRDVVADAVPDQDEHDRPNGGRVVVDEEDAHKNNYVCLSCRRKMATEGWVSCTHQICYCSDCASEMEECPLCEKL